jgi:arylsulfatase A-like enzyme
VNFSRIWSMLLATLVCSAASMAQERPNILWLTAEDHGPHLGAYGDAFATTPHLDAFAEQGLLYRRCWSNAPVCAPARTVIITGVHATSLGAHHMRSLVAMPDNMRLFPQFLREAGYYCTNNAKKDYNVVEPDGVWDELSGRAHWQNRAPGQPFFAVFNDTGTHESRIRDPHYRPRHDPARVPLPAYHPDTPEVRRDWAEYYDRLEDMDARVGERLRELEDAGLADDTIVFFYSDHGAGLPRHKRSPYDSGLRVPLIVHVPDKWRHLAPEDYAPGAFSERLVSFVDLAPTALNLAGVSVPDYMQGNTFLGADIAAPNAYLFGYRGRMDERYDLMRSITDGRYVYLRHYWPHRVEGQYLDYMFQTPTTQVWHEMFEAGLLDDVQSHFWSQKPIEALYDLENDPDEVVSLSNSPEHAEILSAMRDALRDTILRTRDAGFLPESDMHARAGGESIFELARDAERYPLHSILRAAALATDLSADPRAFWDEYATHTDPAIRYWAAIGLLARGAAVYPEFEEGMLRLIEDASPEVRVTAAESLARFGDTAHLATAVTLLLDHANAEKYPFFVCVSAINALDYLEERLYREEYLTIVQNLPVTVPGLDSRFRSYLDRLQAKILADAETAGAP